MYPCKPQSIFSALRWHAGLKLGSHDSFVALVGLNDKVVFIRK